MARNLCVVPGLPKSAEIARSIRFTVSRVTRLLENKSSERLSHPRHERRTEVVAELRKQHNDAMFADFIKNTYFRRYGEYLFAKVLHIFRVISVRAVCVWVIKNT